MPDQPVALKKGRRRPPGLMLWLLLFVALLAGVLMLIVGQTRIRQVVVSGSEHYTNSEVASMAGIDSDTTILDALMGRIDSVEGLPYIDSIEIEYLSFNSIHIMVTEKEVISYIPYQGQYLALDKDGYVVGYESEKIVDRPAVTGLYFKSASLGQKLDISEEVLQSMLDIYHLRTKYSVPLDTLVFVQGDDEMIQGQSGEVTIVFGDASDLDRKMKDAAQVLKRLDLTVAGTLDLQADAEHYIFKEDIGARYYLPYGERYLAVAEDGTIKKISVHRMIHQTLITGLEAVDPEVNQKIVILEGRAEQIDLILNTVASEGLETTAVHFDGDDISLWCGECRMELLNTDDLVLKIQAGAGVIQTLPEGSVGYIDLRTDQEVYEFVSEKTDSQ